ncbi:DUF5693 family protein [Inediibacterium massiliense]|uniref:DUF5693 family protein n=1 Tax=Inediibacterium massiliense TaxID=1658111 RepID=UPI0006B6368A|nr:DUF5693 family protein [Inediibacterium massiliense]
MKKNYILLFIIIFSILVSSITAMGRINVESKNNAVDVVLDYKEFEQMAKQSNKDVSWWFSKLKKQGVSSVGLMEESFESMLKEDKPIKFEMIGNIIKDMDWQKKYPKELITYLNNNEIDEYDVLVTTNSKDYYEFIKNGLESRYDSEKFKIFTSNGEYLFWMDGDIEDALYTEQMGEQDYKGKTFTKTATLYSSKIRRLSLGFDSEKINTIKKSGLKVIPRPYNYESFSGEKYLNATVAEYKKYDIIPNYMIFAGSEVLGYKEKLKDLADYMKKNNIKVGLIESEVQREHIKQDGLYDLTRNLNYNSVRVFSLPSYIQERFKYYNYEGAEEIENALYRAVTERNIRVIYFKPFKYDDKIYVTNYDEYVKMFDQFKGRIAKHKMHIGEASVIESHKVRVRHKMPIGWGIVSGGILLLSYLISMKDKVKYILLGMGILGVSGMIIVMPSLADKLLPLGAAVIFPSLSMLYLCTKLRIYYKEQNKNELIKIIKNGIKDLVVCCFISAIGSLMIGSYLSDIEYLLEMSIFRGVKISQLIPILIYMLIYVGYFGYKNKKLHSKTTIRWKDVKELLFEDVKVIYIILGVIVAAVGYIYIARTGHETSIKPSDLEMIFRNVLEEKLYARPRNKEFLFAFPAIMLGIFMAYRGWKWLIFTFGLAAVIGQTSIVNTFCHLRTPMNLSIARTGYSILLGMIIGSIGVFVLYEGMRFLSMMRGEKLDG